MDSAENSGYSNQQRERQKNNCQVYIIKKQGSNLSFIVDDIYFETPDSYAKIGEAYTDYDPELLNAFNGQSSASKDFYTDEYGTFLSGYAPIKNSNNETVAVIGMDMDIKTVLEKQNFLNSLQHTCTVQLKLHI